MNISDAVNKLKAQPLTILLALAVVAVNFIPSLAIRLVLDVGIALYIVYISDETEFEPELKAVEKDDTQDRQDDV